MASTVAHVAVGAILLATTVVLTIQVWRHVTFRREQPVLEGRTMTA
jgi:methionine-rich copper-binding protein CopC